MTLPTVTEIVRRPEPTTRDTFVADLVPVPRSSGTQRRAQVESAAVFEYDADTFGRDSHDNSGAELIASINFCDDPGPPTHNAYAGTNESFAAVGLDGTWEAPEVEGC